MPTVYEAEATQAQWIQLLKTLGSRGDSGTMQTALKEFYKGAEFVPHFIRDHKAVPKFGWTPHVTGSGNARTVARVMIDAMNRNICVAFDRTAGVVRVIEVHGKQIPTQFLGLFKRVNLSLTQVSAITCPALTALTNTLKGFLTGLKGFMPLFVFESQIRYMEQTFGVGGRRGGMPDA